MIVLEQSASCLRLQIDTGLYGEDVVFKCFYWYGTQYEVEIDKADSENAFVVTLRAKSEAKRDEVTTALLARIRQDLIDFKTRAIVSKETSVIRELLVAKAFSLNDDLDSPPPGDASDPLGFDPANYAANEQPEVPEP